MPLAVPPKPPHQRRRRNRTMPWQILEPPGEDVATAAMPKAPRGRRWTAKARAWWAAIWKTATAQQWQPEDVLVVERLLELVDTSARRELRVGELAAMSRLEADLGIGPRNRRTLGWQIATGSADPRPRSLTLASDVRRLKAVDPHLARRATRK